MSTSAALPQGEGGHYLMTCIKEIPKLKGDNYAEWRQKLDLAFACGEVTWVLNAPKPVEPEKIEREAADTDQTWEKKERDHAQAVMSWSIENRTWTNANTKCMLVLKNVIEPAILGSIEEVESAGDYLQKIKNQFTGSSKTYGLQLMRQLITQKYTGGGIREHILRMYSLNSKLKPHDLEFTPKHVMTMVFASLPKEFDNFATNYSLIPDNWDMEKLIAMCVEEEDKIKERNNGSLNYVRDNKKKNFQTGSSSKNNGKAPMYPQQNQSQNQQKPFPVKEGQCLECKKFGHYKKECPQHLKKIMAKHGIPFDEDYAKKRKTR